MTDEMDELIRRLEMLEARAEIGELASAYAIACDEHDMERLTDLFTPDAVFDLPSGIMHAEGRDAIAAMFVRMFRIRGPAYHWTHDRCVTFDLANPNQAEGSVLSHAETSPNGKTSLAAMRYNDRYSKVNGRWLFARRTISFLYYVPASEYADVFGSTRSGLAPEANGLKPIIRKIWRVGSASPPSKVSDWRGSVPTGPTPPSGKQSHRPSPALRILRTSSGHRGPPAERCPRRSRRRSPGSAGDLRDLS